MTWAAKGVYYTHQIYMHNMNIRLSLRYIVLGYGRKTKAKIDLGETLYIVISDPKLYISCWYIMFLQFIHVQLVMFTYYINSVYNYVWNVTAMNNHITIY